VIRRLNVRDAVDLAPKFLFAVSLSQIYFPYQSIKFAASFILLSIAAHLFQTILEAQLAVSLSFISTAALTQIPVIKSLFIGEPAWHVAVAVLTLFVLIALLYRSVAKKHHESHFFVEIAPAIAMFIISFYWSSSRNLGGLNFLGQSEDNAAWFMGLSFGLSNGGGIRYVSDMSWGGGPVFGVFNGWIVGLKSLGLSREYSSFDNVGSLLSAFGLLLVLTVGSLSSVVLRFAVRSGVKIGSLIPIALGASMIIYASFVSVMALGHYTFMVAIWLVLSAVSVAELNFEELYLRVSSKNVEAVRSFLVSALMIGAALSWRAITPAAIFVCGHFLIQVLNYFIKQKLTKNSVLLLLGLATPVLYLLIKIFGGDTKRGLSLENLKVYFSLEGVAATISPLLLFLFVTVGVIGFLISAEHLTEKRNELAIIVPAYMLLTFILMILIALPTVYGPRYVIQKFELLLFIVFIPLSFFAVAKFAQKINQKYSAPLLVALLVLPFIYDGSMNSGFSYPEVGRSRTTIWAKAAEAELLNNPERRVVCLNTKDPDPIFTDDAAYTCNRILLGIQGLEVDDDYRDWTSLGMWLEDTTRLRSLPDSIYKNMTFIVFDPTFSRIGDEIFMSALNGVPWELVRIVDLSGNQINKN
jgi:hypothetical protein